MKVTTNKQATHRLYAVEKRNGKNYWRPIGAAWAHTDGKGFEIARKATANHACS